jgi:trans-aconitate methyltransferase
MEWIAGKYEDFQKSHQLHYGIDLISKFESVASLSGKTVLDVGCGNGELTLILKDKVGSSGKITAIDPDRGMLSFLRMKEGSEKIDIQQSDAITWLKSTDQKYDIIFSNAVLHWLNTYEEFNEVLYEANRCLCGAGYFAVRFSLYENASTAKQFLEEQLRNYTGDQSLTLRRSFFTFDQCLAWLSTQGFRTIVSEEMKYIPFADRKMSFRWMISSQPLLRYLREEELDHFEQILWQCWQREPIEVRSHQGLFIAQKK